MKGPLGDDICPGAEITFTGEHISRVTTSDRTGSYQLDLPTGLDTMSTRYQVLIGRKPYFMTQSRPWFHAPSGRVVLNVRMFAERLTCDIVVMNKSGEPATSEQWREGEKDLCGSEDRFAVPASDGTPYQLFIKYPKRSPQSRSYEYSGDQLATNTFTPVLVEYNLFTLTAEHVVYDLDRETISATGNVEAVGQLGKSQHAASLTFKISNGEAIPIF